MFSTNPYIIFRREKNLQFKKENQRSRCAYTQMRRFVTMSHSGYIYTYVLIPHL